MTGTAADPFSVAGRCIVITGGGGGLAATLARVLVERHANVVITDVNETALAQVAAEVPGIVSIAGDTTRPRDMQAVMSACEETFGAADVLVNSAAIGCHTAPQDLSLDEWRRVIDVDLTGYFVASQQFALNVIGNGRRGVIVNLSSIASPSAIGRGNIAYSVAKAGIDGMTRELALEWAVFGIRVNAIQPCQIATESLGTLIRTGVVKEPELIRGIPMGRLATASDVIGPVIFLASAASAFITGVCLPVDGGNLAMNAGASLPAIG